MNRNYSDGKVLYFDFTRDDGSNTLTEITDLAGGLKFTREDVNNISYPIIGGKRCIQFDTRSTNNVFECTDNLRLWGDLDLANTDASKLSTRIGNAPGNGYTLVYITRGGNHSNTNRGGVFAGWNFLQFGWTIRNDYAIPQNQLDNQGSAFGILKTENGVTWAIVYVVSNRGGQVLGPNAPSSSFDNLLADVSELVVQNHITPRMAMPTMTSWVFGRSQEASYALAAGTQIRELAIYNRAFNLADIQKIIDKFTLD